MMVYITGGILLFLSLFAMALFIIGRMVEK